MICSKPSGTCLLGRRSALTEALEQTPIAGKFVFKEELASQAGLRLFTATEVQSGRLVLLREFYQSESDPSFPDRFHLELERLKALDHPTIPTTIEGASEGNLHYLVREYTGGEPLLRFREHSPVQVRARAETWINSLAEVLEELHAQNPPFVVGQFGPEDVLVTTMGRLRFLPVRLESLQAPDTLDEFAESSQQTVQIPPYFDVHRLICLAWWMLTGQVPILGQSPGTLNPEEYPEISPQWLRGLQAALDPTYPDPPQTITQLRMLLLGQETVSSEKPPKLEYEVADVKHLNGPKGRRVVQGILKVWNSGGGELNGYCRSTQRWVRILPTAFQGNQVELEFWIDSSGMRAAEEHRAHVFLRSQNSEVDIPVLVTTPPHWLSLLADPIAALFPLLPGLLLMILMCTVLYTGQAGAEESLLKLTRGEPLGQVLNEAVLKVRIPPGDNGPINARVSATIVLGCFVLCPLLVRMIVRRYPPDQRRRLLPAELLGHFSPLLWLAILWKTRTFNHISFAHPDFQVLDIRQVHLSKLILLNLLSATWFFSPVQDRLKPLLERNESLHGLVRMALLLIVLLTLGSVLFS